MPIACFALLLLPRLARLRLSSFVLILSNHLGLPAFLASSSAHSEQPLSNHTHSPRRPGHPDPSGRSPASPLRPPNETHVIRPFFSTA